jgi:hypothetical protein
MRFRVILFGPSRTRHEPTWNILDMYPLKITVVALGEAFYIWNKRFDLDTLRVPSWSPTPISKSNDFRGLSEYIWGARGPDFRPIWEVPGARAGLKHTYFLAL